MPKNWIPILILFLCTNGTAFAQTSTTAFGEALEVNLVNVEVFVTDRQGKPVQGLGEEDFQIFEDGEKMEITHFRAVSENSTEQSLRDVTAGDKMPSAEEQQAYLVAFFDNLHLTPGSRKRVLEGLESFLGGATGWNERVMIVAPQAGGFEVLHPIGAPIAPREAIARLSALPAQGIHVASDRRAVRGQIQSIYELYKGASPLLGLESACTEGQYQMEAAIRSYAQASEARISVVLSSLAHLTSSLAALPGQKIVVYASDGLEFTPGGDLFHYLSEVCPELSTSLTRNTTFATLSQRFDDLVTHANANRVTLYTLDGAGLRNPSISSTDFDDRRFAPTHVNDGVRVANIQTSLSFMADATGGRAILNANRFAPVFAEIEKDTQNFYSIAYQPDHSGDNRKHEIRVKLRGRKDYKLRYRRSYRDKPTLERMADRTMGSLLFGLQENPLQVRLEQGTAKPIDDKTLLVPISIRIPLDQLLFTPQGDQRVGQLRLIMAARDREGRITPLRQQEVGITLSPQQTTDGEVHVFVVQMEMRQGEHVVAVAIRDEATRQTSYLASRMRVGEETESSLANATLKAIR